MHWPEYAYLQELSLPKQGWQQAPCKKTAAKQCSSWCLAQAGAGGPRRHLQSFARSWGGGKGELGLHTGRAGWPWRNILGKITPRLNRKAESSASYVLER